MKVLYFAGLRTRIGRGEEEIDLPAEVHTVGELMIWLRNRGGAYATAFAPGVLVRAAVDQDYAGMDQPVSGATEVAFFPPVTGGTAKPPHNGMAR
jgi:molybdopterin synthase sulfur carrier subunit